MDDSVRQAMTRWPSVPGAYDWLHLDRRGNWYLEDRPIRHPGSVDFIARNYFVDERGRARFQNGPQPVFVHLAYTPWVYRLAAGTDPAAPGSLVTHTGHGVEAVTGAWLDEDGSLLLTTEHGVGVLDDRDLGTAVEAFRDDRGEPLDDDALAEAAASVSGGGGEPAGLWLACAGTVVPVAGIRCADVPDTFGFVPDPRPSDDGAG